MHGIRISAWAAVALAPLWLAVTCGMGEVDVEEQTMAAAFDSAEVVPPLESKASGSVTARRFGNSFEARGTFQGLESDIFEGETAAITIAQGAPGENGPDVFVLQVSTADRRSGTFSLGVFVSEDQIDTFKAGRYYVLIRTMSHPDGELRAQLH